MCFFSQKRLTNCLRKLQCNKSVIKTFSDLEEDEKFSKIPGEVTDAEEKSD